MIKRSWGVATLALFALFAVCAAPVYSQTALKTKANAAQQRAMLAAILNSFQANMGVVNREAAALAAPAIEQIHAIGRAAAAQAQQAHEMSDRQHQAAEARWDGQDKRNQTFSNYLLDQAVISDNQNSGHATVWNQAADALVEGNPSRFGYVETPNFWKSVDY